MTYIMLIFILLGWVVQDLTVDVGDIIGGELTHERFEVRYSFWGSAGDILIFDVQADEPAGSLRLPKLSLLDTYTNELINTLDHTGHFGNVTHQAVLAAELPADGRYYIAVGRIGGAVGESVGTYTLRVIAPEILTDNAVIERTIRSDEGHHYYLVPGDHAFSVLYNQLEGFYYPELRVNIISEDHELHGVGFVSGDRMTRGLLGVYPTGEPYIVTIGLVTSPLLTNEFYFDPASARYTLQRLDE